MIRLIGAVLLAAGAALLGISAARRTRSRAKDLQMVMEGLRAILRELSFRLAPLSELLNSAKEQTGERVQLFFSLCEQGAEHLNGRTFQTVWEQAAEASQMCLEREDWQCLESLGHVLGRYDCENQCQALDTSLSRLEERYRDATEQSQRLGKLYSVLGLTVTVLLSMVRRSK